MVQISLFLLFIILCKGHASLTISIQPHKTVLYGSTVTATCPAEGVTWKLDPFNSDSVQDTDQNPSKVTIEKLTSSTEFTCTKGDETASASVDLINVAGVSSSDCRYECEVSCALYPLKGEPTGITWTSSNSDITALRPKQFKEVDNGEDEIKTNYTHRSDNYSSSYGYQRTTLKIENLVKTTYLTCTFTLDDNSVVEHTVSALIRPTNDCHKDKVCVTKRQCHSSDIISNPACREDCQQCFDYKYIEGDFIGNKKAGMTCENDKSWCEEYLEDRSKCSDSKDRIVKYCSECGNCLAGFSSEKLILPLVILACLCLLTILMCYKSYEEKRSVLPKVHVTNSESRGKIKRDDGADRSERGGRQQTIIPNNLTESHQYLAPSSALQQEQSTPQVQSAHDNSSPDCNYSDNEPVQVVEQRDARTAIVMQHRHQTSSLEQNLNFGSEDDMRSAEIEVETGVVSEREVEGETKRGVVCDVEARQQVVCEVEAKQDAVCGSEVENGVVREQTESNLSTRDIEVQNLTEN